MTIALLAACSTKIPTKEKSSTPQTGKGDPEASFQPDPEPGEAGAPFGDASGAPPIDAGCPDAMPDGGMECPTWIGPFDCRYFEDGGELRCTCKVTPEGAWWSCGPTS